MDRIRSNSHEIRGEHLLLIFAINCASESIKEECKLEDIHIMTKTLLSLTTKYEGMAMTIRVRNFEELNIEELLDSFQGYDQKSCKKFYFHKDETCTKETASL